MEQKSQQYEEKQYLIRSPMYRYRPVNGPLTVDDMLRHWSTTWVIYVPIASGLH
jgi:hypothetical protein